MLEYIIFSGIACMVSTRVFSMVTKDKMDKLGYVRISDVKEPNKVKPKDYVLGVLFNFVPILNN